MKKIFSSVKSFVKNNKWKSILIVLVLIVVSLLVFGNKKTIIPDTVTVEKHSIVEVVSVTGNVKPLSDLDLSFETGGQVSRVNVSVGDKVYQGQVLASLSNADLVAAVEQAKAGLKIAEANLSSLQNGATREQIAVNQSQVEKAQSDLSNTLITLVNTVRDVYTKSDDAIRNYTDPMFDNPRTQNPSLLFQTDQQLQNDLISQRTAIEGLLSSLNNSIVDLTTNVQINSAITIANNTLSTIQEFLQNLAFAVNKLLPNSSISQTTINTWKSNISTSRSSIDTSKSNLSTVMNNYQSATAALNIANSQLTLTKTGATNDQLNAQEATVEQARANVNAAQARLNKSIIYSPISGVITNVIAKVGQTIQAGMSAVSVISYGQYDVEAFVPEADIAKVKVGDTATTTLDAYGSDTFFDTSVIAIDPGETVRENVPTYKVTLKFASTSDSRIKSGMTANLDILTGQASNVLAIPSRSVYTVDTQKYVKVIDINNPKNQIEKKVETGMKGDDGYIVIISGLKEGDKVLSTPHL